MLARAQNEPQNARAFVNRWEAAREALGLPLSAVAMAAGIDEKTYRRIAGGTCQPHPSTAKKIDAAIAQLKQVGRAPRLPQSVRLIRAVFEGQVAAQALSLGLNPADIKRQAPELNRPKDPAWLAAARVRRRAMYLVVVALDVPAAKVAEALGLTRQAVSKAIKELEDARDEPAIDAELEAATQWLEP